MDSFEIDTLKLTVIENEMTLRFQSRKALTPVSFLWILMENSPWFRTDSKFMTSPETHNPEHMI